MDRAGLFTDVLDDLNREDKASKLPGWLQTTAFKINKLLRTDKMVTRRILTVTETTFPLPDDFLSHVSLSVRLSLTDPVRPGDKSGTTLYVSPQAADDATHGEYTQWHGGPRYFTIRGRVIELLNWHGDGPYQIDLYYFASLPVLVEDTDTNWLMDDAYEIYKYGMLALGFNHLQEFDTASRYDAMMQSQIQAMNDEYEKEKYGAGPLIARPARRMGGRRS